MTLQLPALPAVVHPPLPLLLLSFSLGVIAIRLLPWLPSIWWFAGIAALLIAVLFRWPKFQLSLVFVLGICWAGWHAASFQATMIPKALEKKDLVVTGTISGLVTPQLRGSIFDFDVHTLEFDQRQLDNPGTIRLSSYDTESEFQSGQAWKFTVRLKRPRSLVNPGMGFDYAAWLYSKGISAKGYIVKGSANPVDFNANGLRYFASHVDMVRKGFSNFLQRQEIGSSEQSIFGALSVGVRDQMDAETWQVLRDTGTAHLVAISGLHIGLVALIAGMSGGMLWGVTGSIRNRISKPAVRWWFGLVAASIYAMLAGFPLPTQRAVTMLVVAALVVLCRRMVPAGWLLSAALSVVLLLNPLAPLANSFWMSFVAVIILVFSFRNRDTKRMEATHCLTRPGYKLVRVLKGWIQMQLWLFVGMVPVLLIGFQQISIVSPLANLVAVPVIGMLIVPLVLLALVTWYAGLEQLSSFSISLCSWMFEFTWSFLSWLSEQPLATWREGTPDNIAIVVAVAGFLLLVFGRTLPWRWLAGAWLLPLFFQPPYPVEYGQFRYTLLDVGQGLASVIQTQNHTLVFDTGAKYASGFDLGEVVVVPFLRSRNITRIDRLLVSHGDNDHAGGAPAVISAIETGQLLTGDVNSSWIAGTAQSCKAGQKWQWEGVEFAVLWPSSSTGPGGNDASCVLKVSSRFGSLLLTGDIEKSTERRLLERSNRILASDLLQIPHHGSLTSSIPEFIRAVNPRLALNSSGYLNRFGHPHPTVLQRYKSENIMVMTTSGQGAIEATFSATGIHIVSERARNLRFWRDNEDSVAQFSLPTPIGKTPGDIISG